MPELTSPVNISNLTTTKNLTALLEEIFSS